VGSMYSHHSKNGTNQASAPERYVGDCLLEIDNWKLIKARFSLYSGTNSFPVHFCGESPEGYGVHRTHDCLLSEEVIRRLEGRCIKCNEKAPDEIIGLWTLHNWEQVTA
jgi:hypothetical protein